MNSATNNVLPALRLGAPHGLKGQLRAQVLLADPQVMVGLTLASRQSDGQTGPDVTLMTLQPQTGGSALVTVAGVADRTTAEKLVGLTLLLPRARLPAVGEHEIYLGDLLGRDVAGYGQVTALREAGGQDLLELTLRAGKKILIPAHAAFFEDLRADKLVLSELGQQLIEL